MRLPLCSVGAHPVFFFFFWVLFFSGGTNPNLDSPAIVTQYSLANSFAIRLGEFKLRPSFPCCHVYLTGAAIALADWGAIRQTVEREPVQVSSVHLTNTLMSA
jgi:hypothetical protein